MSMIKYGTYRIFINEDTQELKKVKIDSIEADELEKSASWVEQHREAEEDES